MQSIMCNPHTVSTDSLCNSNNITIQNNIQLPNSCATPHQKQTDSTSSLQLIHQHIPSVHPPFAANNLENQHNISRQSAMGTSPSKSASGVQKSHSPGQVGDYVFVWSHLIFAT